MKNSRILTGVLGGLLLLVWGRIGLQVADAFGGGDETGRAAPGPLAPISSEIRFIFPPGVRDPFRYVELSTKGLSKRNEQRDRVKEWVPPPLRLTGVVVEAKGSTAIIESGDGSVHFLRRGDTLSGATVLRISPGVVAYTFRDKRSEWIVESK